MGLLWLPSPCPGPWLRHLCYSTQLAPNIPREAVRELQSPCSQATLAGWVPLALGRWIPGLVEFWGGCKSGLAGMAASSPSAGWEGSLERKPGPQVAEKDIRSRGNSRESKQTGLCVAADWRLRREARPVVVGRGGGRWPGHDSAC